MENLTVTDVSVIFQGSLLENAKKGAACPSKILHQPKILYKNANTNVFELHNVVETSQIGFHA